MIKILNLIFSFLKFILLIISFGVSFFIVISMDSRVGRSIMSSIYIFLPFVIGSLKSSSLISFSIQ